MFPAAVIIADKSLLALEALHSLVSLARLNSRRSPSHQISQVSQEAGSKCHSSVGWGNELASTHALP